MKMMNKTKWDWKSRSPGLEVDMHIDLGRLEGNYAQAQYKLDSAIMTDMEPYMPKVTGGFIQRTKAMSAAVAGTGIVYAAAPPSGRFLYQGKNMVSEESGSTWAKLGERKVLVSEYNGLTRAAENLRYTKTFNANVQPKWFDAAKNRRMDSWVKLAKKTAGGG